MQLSYSPSIDNKELFHSTHIYDRNYKHSSYSNYSQSPLNEKLKMVR